MRGSNRKEGGKRKYIERDKILIMRHVKEQRKTELKRDRELDVQMIPPSGDS